MRQRVKDMQPTQNDVREIHEFVRWSEGIPQLTKARMQAIVLLWNLKDENAPLLGPAEVMSFLRSSPLYAGTYTPSEPGQDRRKVLVELLQTAVSNQLEAAGVRNESHSQDFANTANSVFTRSFRAG